MTSVPAREALFGPLLRLYRNLAGRTIEDAARALGRGGLARLPDIETARERLQEKDLQALLACYGFAGPEQESLEGLLLSDERDWWDAYPSAQCGDFALYRLMELAASRISFYQPIGVPDLFQTAEYAAAAARARPEVPGHLAGQYAEAVLAHQDAVLRGPRLPVITALLGTSAIAQEDIGPVMAAQARALGSPRRGRTVAYIPHATAWLAGTWPFTLLEFRTGPSRAVAFQPAPGGGRLVTDPGEAAAFTRVFTGLCQAAAGQAPPPGAERPQALPSGERLQKAVPAPVPAFPAVPFSSAPAPGAAGGPDGASPPVRAAGPVALPVFCGPRHPEWLAPGLE